MHVHFNLMVTLLNRNIFPVGPSFTSLPPHPNIMHVLGSFCDDIPLLPDATHSYPAALPSKYGDGGFSRNRTKFLVMPRSVKHVIKG